MSQLPSNYRIPNKNDLVSFKPAVSTVAASGNQPSPCQFRLSYLRSSSGILKLAETALSVASLVCAAIAQTDVGDWGIFVSCFGLAECAILFSLNVTGVVEYTGYNLPLWVLLSAGVNTVFFLVVSIVTAVNGDYLPHALYAFFGLATCCILVADAVLQYRSIRSTTGFAFLTRSFAATQQKSRATTQALLTEASKSEFGWQSEEVRQTESRALTEASKSEFGWQSEDVGQTESRALTIPATSEGRTAPSRTQVAPSIK